MRNFCGASVLKRTNQLPGAGLNPAVGTALRRLDEDLQPWVLVWFMDRCVRPGAGSEPRRQPAAEDSLELQRDRDRQMV